MRKGVTALHNIRLLKWCAEIGVDPQWNLLFGLPGEPPEEYERMADLIPSLVHLKPPALCPIQIQRFSPYYQRSADFGIEIVGPVPYYQFLYGPRCLLRRLGYPTEIRMIDRIGTVSCPLPLAAMHKRRCLTSATKGCTFE